MVQGTIQYDAVCTWSRFKVNCHPSVCSIWVTLYLGWYLHLFQSGLLGAGQSLSSKLVLGWVGPAGQGIFHNGTYVHACLFLYFSWTALHVSAQETRSSCVVSFLIHTVDTGFLAELRSDSDPRCFALSTVGFSVMKSIMGDDGVPLVDYSDYRQILWDWKPSATFPPYSKVVKVILKGSIASAWVPL